MPHHQIAPEILYADTTAKKRAYSDLSHRCAAAGDSYRAVHAAWAADVNTVQAVMWERVMVASPNPDQQFAAIAETISTALVAHASRPPSAGTAREAVENAREGLAAAFDPAAQRVIAEHYLNLDHLNGLPHPTAADAQRLLMARTHGDPVHVVATRKRSQARESMSAAMRLERDGDSDAAMQQAWQADWATFEAYLLDVSEQVGDRSLVMVDMRWAIAVDLFTKIPSLPGDLIEAVSTVRERLVQSVGAIEGERLQEQFEYVL